MMSEEEEMPRLAKARQGSSRAVTGGTGVNGLTKTLKSKFFRISSVSGLSLDRFFRFITKGPIFWKIGSRD